MTNTSVPQTTEKFRPASCPACGGMGTIRENSTRPRDIPCKLCGDKRQKSLIQRIADNPCESVAVSSAVPIITLNISEFVDALNRPTIAENGTQSTALDGLAELLKAYNAERTIECGMCGGYGVLRDPFEDDAPEEACPACHGDGRTLYVTIPASFRKNVLAALALVSDLRAALEYAQGGKE